MVIKENPDRKKEANSALPHVKTDFQSMMGEECLDCIHWDIFIGRDKIIDIYASRCPRRMLLINPLSENENVETFNAVKAHKAYIDFTIFSLYFIVVIWNFGFASTN